MAVANCPSCGGQINFAIGSSAVVICDYCHSVVARTDRGLEDLGKVAALIDTGSPLRRDLPGSYRGVGFRLVGRTQMRHEAGGMWDSAKDSRMSAWSYDSPRRGAATPSRPFGEFDGCIGGWDLDGEPYTQAKGSTFDWFRGRMLGGRTNHWGRISLRMGPDDFKRRSLDGGRKRKPAGGRAGRRSQRRRCEHHTRRAGQRHGFRGRWRFSALGC